MTDRRTTDEMPYDDVRVEVRDDHVALVLIDRPPRNALVPTTLVEFWDALVRLDEDPHVRCIVVTGEGPHFSAGVDMSRASLLDPATGRVDRGELRRLRREATEQHGYRYRNLLELVTPVVAAVNGAAVGGGLAIALQADIRLVADDARLSIAFAKRGLVPELGLAWLLPRLVGQARAVEFVLTGRELSGTDAVDYGLASRVVAAEDLRSEALALAAQIARHSSPLALAVSKRMLWGFADGTSYAQATRLTEAAIDWIVERPDVGEGIRAFVDRRAPAWQTATSDPLPPFLPAIADAPAEHS